MTGVILCGGASSRMGSDKGLLQTGAVYWAQRSAAILAANGLPVVFSVSNVQSQVYARAFPGATLICDHMSLAVKGPLKGILSVHRNLPEETLFVLACDMQEMEPEVPAQLLRLFRDKPAPAYVYAQEQYAEPLCGIYTAAALESTDRRYQEYPSNSSSMQFVLQQMQAVRVSIPSGWLPFFTNYNTPIS